MSGFDRLKSQMVTALRGHLKSTHTAPPVPEAGLVLWNAFQEMDETRSFHSAGPNPISYAEIESWGRLKGYPLQPRHVEIIRAMDVALIEHFNAEAKRRDEANRRRRGAKMTPAMFDAATG